MTISNLLTRVRSLAAGDAGRGLHVDDFQVWLQSVPFERRLAMFREGLGLLAELRAENDSAHEESRQDMQRRAQTALDAGKRFDEPYEPDKDAVLLRMAEGRRGRLEALGVVPPSLNGVNARVSVLAESLKAHYVRHGEPDELVSLRREVNDLKLSAWAPLEAVKDAHARVKKLGVAAGDNERAAIAAGEALAAAIAKHHAKRGELWSRFAIKVRE